MFIDREAKKERKISSTIINRITTDKDNENSFKQDQIVKKNQNLKR